MVRLFVNAKGAPIRVPLMPWRRRWTAHALCERGLFVAQSIDLRLKVSAPPPPRAALTAYEISSHRPHIPPRHSFLHKTTPFAHKVWYFKKNVWKSDRKLIEKIRTETALLR